MPLDQSSANWIFQVVSHRYEKSSPIVLTSNRGFSDWGQVFADQVVAAVISTCWSGTGGYGVAHRRGHVSMTMGAVVISLLHGEDDVRRRRSHISCL